MNRTYPSATILFRWHRIATSKALTLFAFIVLFSLAGIAQTSPANHPRRMKIGVALEGGRAGLAHIGVLLWFEQHHIPIDYLSGNSMGGLVGGLYATGQSPDDIERTVKKMDWPLLLRWRNPVSRSFIPPQRRCTRSPKHSGHWFQKRTGPPFRLECRTSDQSLHRSRNTSLLDVKSFDDLPIPFRCVATDLVSGKGARVLIRPDWSGDAIDHVPAWNLRSYPRWR